jgi:hypothetical protein
MPTGRPVFASPDEEREYVTKAKAELDRCETKAEVIEVWKRHYLTLGHKKLGRLLLDRPVGEILKARE